jgi:ATP-binding cassette subfamily B protein
MFQGLARYGVVYKHLWRTYGQTWQVRLSFTLQLLTRICKLIALPIALSIIIAKLSVHDYAAAYRAVWLYVAFSFTLGVLTPITKYIGMRGENIVYDKATGDYFDKLVRVDIDYFNDNLAGYLTTATRQYADSCIQLVRALRDRYVGTVLSIIFPLLVIAWVDWMLGLVVLVLSVAQAVYMVWASNAIARYRTHARELYKQNSGRMADVISNILAVRSTAQEAEYVERVRKGAVEEGDAFTLRYTMQAKLIASREAITVTVFMIWLWLTVHRMSGSHIQITAAVLVVTYTTTILTGIYALSDDLDAHDDLVDRIIPAFEILDRKNNICDPDEPKKLSKVRGDVRLEQIGFSYENGAQNVFKNFSLHIPAGQKVGVVGLSGAGKSTLTKLLLRFNDVQAGSILLDGIDIRQVRQVDLRQQIAYVPQEPLNKPNATEAEIRRALKAAHADQFIAQLPNGLDSVVGERGVKLSGGQKQRIAIARAVLRHAPIMILDEATSALDSESEHIIKSSFAQILKGKTAIVIAHRLSTLSEMDRIIVIDNGQCVEDGTHQELLAAGGVYARLWKRQLKHLDE